MHFIFMNILNNIHQYCADHQYSNSMRFISINILNNIINIVHYTNALRTFGFHLDNICITLLIEIAAYDIQISFYIGLFEYES